MSQSSAMIFLTMHLRTPNLAPTMKMQIPTRIHSTATTVCVAAAVASGGVVVADMMILYVLYANMCYRVCARFGQSGWKNLRTVVLYSSVFSEHRCWCWTKRWAVENVSSWMLLLVQCLVSGNEASPLVQSKTWNGLEMSLSKAASQTALTKM